MIVVTVDCKVGAAESAGCCVSGVSGLSGGAAHLLLGFAFLFSGQCQLAHWLFLMYDIVWQLLQCLYLLSCLLYGLYVGAVYACLLAGGQLAWTLPCFLFWLLSDSMALLSTVNNWSSLSCCCGGCGGCGGCGAGGGNDV